jgi:hypothetical protein
MSDHHSHACPRPKPPQGRQQRGHAARHEHAAEGGPIVGHQWHESRMGAEEFFRCRLHELQIFVHEDGRHPNLENGDARNQQRCSLHDEQQLPPVVEPPAAIVPQAGRLHRMPRRQMGMHRH